MLKALEKETKNPKISYIDIIDKKIEYICPECLSQVIFVDARWKEKNNDYFIANFYDGVFWK